MLLLVTSAQVDHLNEMRTKEYEKTIEWAKVKDSEGYNVVWLECISATEPPYLKGQFPCYCTDNHNPNYQNKGSNLGMAMRKFFDDCEVDDDYADLLGQTRRREPVALGIGSGVRALCACAPRTAGVQGASQSLRRAP